jgi:putative ABC transport system permease protein
MFIGFFISIAALFVVISVITEINKLTNDYSNGNFKYVEKVTILFEDDYEMTEIENILKNNFKDSDIAVEFESIETENGDMIFVTGILPKDKYLWVPQIIEGEFLDENSSERVAVIGKNILNRVENNELVLGDKKYKVKGIIGKNEQSVIDTSIFIPINYMPELLGREWKEKKLSFVVKNNKNPKDEIDNFSKELLNKWKASINIENDDRLKQERGFIVRAFELTLKDMLKMFLISIFNIVNISYFWIHTRRKEIGLRKIWGASNISIYKLILKEILFICMMASVLVFPFLFIISKFSMLLFYYEINVSLYKFGLSVLISLLTCILTALIPTIAAFRVQPVVVVKE